MDDTRRYRSMIEWTLEKFKRAGRSHLASAEHVLNAGADGRSRIRPGTAAYLAHVALECVLKARLLYRGGCASAEDLKRKNPKVHDKWFGGKHGHNLRLLAEHLRLPGLMQTEGRPWCDDRCWGRIASDERPYALRYGAEDVTVSHVRQELDRTSQIVDAVLAGTASIPLVTPRRGRRRK